MPERPSGRRATPRMHRARLSVRRILLIFPTVLQRKHVNQKRFVTILSGRTVTISALESMLAYGDREPSGATPISAVIRPRQLDFLIAVSG